MQNNHVHGNKNQITSSLPKQLDLGAARQVGKLNYTCTLAPGSAALGDELYLDNAVGKPGHDDAVSVLGGEEVPTALSVPKSAAPAQE